MTSIPQCMNCKYGKIQNGIIICEKHEQIPEKITNGSGICKEHEKPQKSRV